MPVSEAIVQAAEKRFRPIVLTSVTTLFGLLPLLLEASAQAQWIKPIVVSLAFGVLFATVITLLLVPAIYIVLESISVAATSKNCALQNVATNKVKIKLA